MNEDLASVLFINVGDVAAGSPEQLERITLQLRRAIRELPVDAVDPVKAQTTGRGGSKAIDGALIGTLAIKLLPEVVPVLCQLLNKWIGGAHTRRLTVICGGTKIEISGDLTPEQTGAIVRAMNKKATPHGG